MPEFPVAGRAAVGFIGSDFFEFDGDGLLRSLRGFRDAAGLMAQLQG